MFYQLPVSNVDSVRLGTAGFSMSGKKGTDIEALDLPTFAFLQMAVLCPSIQGETLGCAALGGLVTLSLPQELGRLQNALLLSFLCFTENLINKTGID